MVVGFRDLHLLYSALASMFLQCVLSHGQEVSKEVKNRSMREPGSKSKQLERAREAIQNDFLNVVKFTKQTQI